MTENSTVGYGQWFCSTSIKFDAGKKWISNLLLISFEAGAKKVLWVYY